MDDLVALFAEEENNEDNYCSDQDRLPQNKKRKKKQKTKGSQLSQKSDRIVDDRVAIRMHNRILSSDALSTLINEGGFPFHSTAQLASYSLHHWNSNMLQEPTAIVNEATVMGKTVPFSTLGIVFTTSGSRVSATSGHAFLSCTVGTLTTGPVITVLLFGDAVRTHCRSVQPGMVVALLQPKLLPQRSSTNHKDPTTVCFSISDETQLRRVGQATDYGRCCGTAWSSKQGGSAASSRPCTQWIDKRNGKYCRLHGKQQNKGPTKTTTGASSSTQQHPLLALRNQQRRKVPPTRQPPTRVATLEERKRASNALLNPPSNRRSTPMGSTATTNSNRLHSNPYATVAPQRAPVRVTPAAPPIAKRRRVMEDVLQMTKTKSKQAAPKQLKKLNIDHSTGQFNGSVRIPQPSRMFAAVAPVPTNTAAGSQQHLGVVSAQERRARMQASQQRLAAQLKSAKAVTVAPTSLGGRKKKQKKAAAAPSTDAFADAFGGASTAPASSIIEAQSQFVSQADAEEYVQWRQRATLLEQKEERLEKQNQNEPRKIQTNWHCCDCERSFGATAPRACIRQNHRVKRTRVLPKTTSVAEQRQKQSEAEGGLVLGGGLEWSGRNWST